MHEAQQDAGRPEPPVPPHDLDPFEPGGKISLIKNRSSGSLHQNLSFTPGTHTETSEELLQRRRSRASLDGSGISERDSLKFTPLVAEPEHGFGISGLRRIRQGPPSRTPSRAPSGTLSRTPTAPPSPETRFEPLLSRAASMNLHVSSSRGFSVDASGSAMAGFGEDLQRFPSESLHSFSFARHSEEMLHNRSTVLKKSIEFIRDKPALAAGLQHPGLMMAQAKVSGDQELQEILALLNKARVLDSRRSSLFGAMTGPVTIDEENVFDKGFGERSASPESLGIYDAQESQAQPSKDTITATTKNSKAFEFNHVTQIPESKRVRSISPGPAVNVIKRPLASARPTFKRTVTDTRSLQIQTQLSDALARPYHAQDPSMDSALLSPTAIPPFIKAGLPPTTPGGTNHSVARWHPASQAIFTTSTAEPYTILAANDLACLVFGVTRGEIRKLGIMEMIQRDRRDWLKTRLESPGSEAAVRNKSLALPTQNSNLRTSSNLPMSKGGITAMLLSKPPSRVVQRAQSDAHAAESERSTNEAAKPRGVLLCGDIVPVQKRNGAVGSASLWVKEKKGYLIWAVEEIVEDRAELTLDENGKVLSSSGEIASIWTKPKIAQGTHVSRLIPRIPTFAQAKKAINYGAFSKDGRYCAKNDDGFNIPLTISARPHLGEVKVSSYPHIAGIVVVSANDMRITSSNAVFVKTLFGHTNPQKMHITDIVPQFVKLVDEFTEDGQEVLTDGAVIPEHSFRRARAQLAFREDGFNAAETLFLKPTGIPAKHADGSEIFVDIQMRVVNSETAVPEEAIIEEKDDEELHELIEVETRGQQPPKLVYALWLTYSRHLHSSGGGTKTPLVSRPSTPPKQPSPGQTVTVISSEDDADTPVETDSLSMKEDIGALVGSSNEKSDSKEQPLSQSEIEREIEEATSQPISKLAHPVIKIRPELTPDSRTASPEPSLASAPAPVKSKKRSIDDFVILEDMGQGAYGQVKLARYKDSPAHKVVLKYVNKKRILVDTWMRDRKLGTVPSEIHVLNFLRKDGMRHPNIVEMVDFFEDKDNYYIMMVPHGLPGMDLFDYIEMRQNMEEDEVRNIFVQVADAVYHLHEVASIVHRDIKDENIILDGENRVKLIDFGSAAYTRNGPFDVFVGTIDYAAPEVITGQSYRGKPQDIWALGILLYTLIYKENPFYNVDEILERDLRVPFTMSESSLELVRAMLNRDVDQRYTIQQITDHPWVKREGREIVKAE